MKKRFDIACFFLLLALLFSVACIFKRPIQTPAQTLRVGFIMNSPDLKDKHCEFSPCTELRNLTDEGLFRMRLQNNRWVLEPALAESWSFPDDKSIKIFLKKNLKTSKGNPISAADFIKSWETALSSKNFKEAQFLLPIFNAQAFFENKVPFSKVGIKISDDQSIFISLSTSARDFILNLSHPSTWLNPRGNNHSGGPAGPFFEVPSMEPHKIKLLRNPHYWGKQPFYNSIELIKFFDPTTARNYFEDKELGMLLGSISELPNANRIFLPTPTKYFLQVNKANIPMNEPRFKEALIYSIDKTEWLNLLHLNIILVSNLDNRFEKDEQPNSFYNSTKAKELFSRISKETGRMAKMPSAEIRPPILVYPEELETVAVNLKMQWLKTLNIQIEIVPKLAALHLSKNLPLNWDLELSSFNFYPNSKPIDSETYFPLFSKVQIVSTLSNLKGFTSNPWGGIDLSQITL